MEKISSDQLEQKLKVKLTQTKRSHNEYEIHTLIDPEGAVYETKAVG